MASRDLANTLRPGRPRSDKARAAILSATWDLLMKSGFAGLTIEQIAVEAGVGKATIYRWWNGKGPLAIEAFLEHVAPQIAFGRSNSAIADIRNQVPLVARAYRGRIGIVLREIIGVAQDDEETRKLYVDGYLEPRRSAAKQVLQRAVDQGELAPDVDLDIMVDAVYGPIFHRMTSGHLPITDTFVTGLLDIALPLKSPP